MAEPPADWAPYLGNKVSLRYRLRGDPQHPFSEAIGVLASLEDAPDGARLLRIFNRRGNQISVPVDDILAAKIFPP